jgi:alkaline phosphatase
MIPDDYLDAEFQKIKFNHSRLHRQQSANMGCKTFPGGKALHRSGRLNQLLFVLITSFLVCVQCAADSPPKNVILLAGDGMGIGHITAARIAGPGRDGRLAIDSMPVTGVVLTHSANALVTDSAAAGTALATGHKTNNGTISQTPEGKPLVSLLKLAQTLGKAGGIISTKFITDATPAVFVSNAAKRSQRETIAKQTIESGAQVILGGGREDFLPRKDGGARSDEVNLLDEAKRLGYQVVQSREEMASANGGRILGLFAESSMTDGDSEPTLAEMTAKAISVLARNPKGFFLMSEGAKIDSEAHANNAEGVVREVLDFDKAVQTALEFAKKDKQTLVVVTADHDTGGLSVLEPSNDNQPFKAGWTTGGHTGNMVLVYAYGPGAVRFTGTHDNTEIPNIIANLWGKKLN